MTRETHLSQTFNPPSPHPPRLTHSGSLSSFSSLDTNKVSPDTRPQSDSVAENVQPGPKQSDSASGSSGIPEPNNAKSRRRLRRPFTAEEDDALLKGYSEHGFQWTAIQQDQQLNLGHRRSTDLRDRFRTRFPHAYRDGGSVRGYALQALVVRDMIRKDGANGTPGGKHNLPESKRASSDDCPRKPDNTSSSAAGTGDSDSLSPGLPSAGSATSGPIGEDHAHTSVDLAPLVWDDLA